MTNHREILRLKALGFTHKAIATSCGCGRNTVTRTLERARATEMDWETAQLLTAQQVTDRLFTATHATPNYKMPDYQWVHREMQKSGVTRILVPDNLKTGVISNNRNEIILNKTYQEMAEHYGTAILPARPRTPKDKAFVEGAVGVVSTWILAALRNQQFLSLAELNRAIAQKLEDFNRKPFQKRDGSRKQSFQEEQLFLLPLPATTFELATWKIATVQYNYHVQVESMHYSVPHEYIKEKVDIRSSRETIEVFYGGNRIASHLRLHGRSNQYSTQDDHMPPNHKQFLQWNGVRFRSWAQGIGSHTTVLVDLFLSTYKVEQQGYKSCMALLKLSESYGVERLELACKKALSFTSTPSLKSVQAILKSRQELMEPAQSTKPSSHSFTRGAEYYGGKK